MKKGISLIVLIITIIVMIIIAGAVIISLSNSNIIDQADKAKTKWDIASIKEQLTIHNALAKTGTNTEIKNGTLKDIGIDDESWNEKVIIQDGKLVFLPENLTDEEESAMLSAGVEQAVTHISIVNASTKTAKYANENSVITPEDLLDKINANPNIEKIYILEDLTNWNSDIYDGQLEYYGVLDGLGHTVTNLEKPMFYDNYGTIRGIIIDGQYDVAGEGFGGTIAEMNYKLIEDCHNKADIMGNYVSGGIVAYNEGTIYRCSNSGIVTGSESVGGIVGYNEYMSIEEPDEWEGARVIECYNSGKIGAWDKNGNRVEDMEVQEVGGIIGFNTGLGWDNKSKPVTCQNCYNTGEIAGTTGVSGLIGYTRDSKSTIVKDSYNLGNIDASSDTVSLAFFNSRNITITNCFAKNNTSTKLVNFDGYSYADDITVNVDWINNLVNDGEVETQADRNKLLEMLNAGNTEEVWVKDTNNINNGYPILKWQLDK